MKGFIEVHKCKIMEEGAAPDTHVVLYKAEKYCVSVRSIVVVKPADIWQLADCLQMPMWSRQPTNEQNGAIVCFTPNGGWQIPCYEPYDEVIRMIEEASTP